MDDRPRKQALGTLFAPWRLAYLEDTRDTSSGSFLRDYWEHPQRDGENFVLVRTDQGMILLNRYPYANGHLLVALGEARARLMEYDAPQRRALWDLVDRAADLIERALAPQGINIGINQGSAAGAGVPGHLHVHLVPRWGGDTNFMTTIGQVRVIPASLDAMARRYRAVIEADGE